MSREIKRVPADFVWPLYQRWHGYLRPDTYDEIQCPACEGSGYSPQYRTLQDLWYGYLPFDPATTGSTPYTAGTPIIRARAERNCERDPSYYDTSEHAIVHEAQRLADYFNSTWSHHIADQDVEALLAADRLWDFTRHWSPEHRWQRVLGGRAPTATEVNTWSLTGMGHDSSNAHCVIAARCEQQGAPIECAACDGDGSTERYPGQRAEADAWERTQPPTGDAWQLWETTSEGSPISPVFATADELATWMSNPNRSDRYKKDWVPYPAALQFIKTGWAPSGVITTTDVVSGVEWIGMADETASLTDS